MSPDRNEQILRNESEVLAHRQQALEAEITALQAELRQVRTVYEAHQPVPLNPKKQLVVDISERGLPAAVLKERGDRRLRAFVYGLVCGILIPLVVKLVGVVSR